MKPYIVVQGPVATRSGYGNHTRDICTSLIQSGKYDVEIISLPWGNTPTDALKADNSEHQAIINCIARQNIQRKPDIFIQVSVANEFQPYGKYNIGITAGVETDQPPGEFIEGCNRMDLIIATSEFTKKGLESVSYDKMDRESNTKIGELKLTTPVEVLAEGVDTTIYKKLKPSELHASVSEYMDSLPTTFNFLFVGHWLRGTIGNDRKDIGMMIKTFCETFKNKSAKNRPGLVLKTSHATFSIMDRDEIFNKVQGILEPYGDKAPNVYLLHGDLTDEEMNSLYNHPKIHAMVSFTKGEGFGRPLLEFTFSGKPVIASDHSGQKDFLKHAHMLPGTLTKVDSSAADQFILRGSQWFTVNYQYASQVLKDCVENYKNYLSAAKEQFKVSRKYFTRDDMAKRLCEIVDNSLQSVPQTTMLQLPKLTKTTPDVPKVVLPKLTKATK
jgi:glycosyltransferase involved in cell wall biosynthesis